MADPFAVEPRPVATRSRLSITSSEGQPVTIVGIDIPFWDIVAFMVKWAVASIPSAFVLILLGILVGAVLSAMTGLSLY